MSRLDYTTILDLKESKQFQNEVDVVGVVLYIGSPGLVANKLLRIITP